MKPSAPLAAASAAPPPGMVSLRYSVCSSVVVVGVRDVLDLLEWAEEEEGAKAEKSKNLRVCKKRYR